MRGPGFDRLVGTTIFFWRVAAPEAVEPKPIGTTMNTTSPTDSSGPTSDISALDREIDANLDLACAAIVVPLVMRALAIERGDSFLAGLFGCTTGQREDEPEGGEQKENRMFHGCTPSLGCCSEGGQGNLRRAGIALVGPLVAGQG